MSVQGKSMPTCKWRRRMGKAAVSVMSGLALLCAAVLPASALEKESYCGYEEHTHGEDCYELTLICGQTGTHTHGPECYREERVLQCGMEEREAAVHTHSDSCRTQQKELICGMEEREAGTHTHGEQCYTQERTLTCTLEENTAVHTHTHSCMAQEQRLICTDTSEEHTHGEGCYETTESIVCGLAEGAALGHVHTDECYSTEKVLSCTLRDGEEIAGHTHTEACYSTKEILGCGYEEGEKIPAHTHTDGCYGTEKVLICQLQESTADIDAGTEQAADGAQDSGHTHTEACYQKTLVCQKAVHRHELSCFSNPDADRESAWSWEHSLADVELSGEWESDLIAIAKTQLGYTESTRNYIVAQDGTKKGYTRYGAWYGIEYGDWCAMFVSFCMHYAEISEESFPPDSSCENWIKTLKSEKYALYRERETYTPKVGDVVFFDWGADGHADHVGIVAELRYDGKEKLTGIQTIEGNAGNRVCGAEYEIEDERILGYGELPENPIAAYHWRGDGMEVTASVERSEDLPEKAELVVQRLAPKDEDGYAERFAQARATLAAEEPAEITRFDLFRVYLEADGQEVLPDKEATVEIRLLDEKPAAQDAEHPSERAEAEKPDSGENSAQKTLEAPSVSLDSGENGVKEPEAKESEKTGQTEARLFRYTEDGAQMRAPEQSEKSSGLSGQFKTRLSGEYAIALARETVERGTGAGATDTHEADPPETDASEPVERGTDTGDADTSQAEPVENYGAAMKCAPHGSGNREMLAHGHRFEKEEAVPTESVTADARRIGSAMVTLLAAAALLALPLTLLVKAGRRKKHGESLEKAKRFYAVAR